MEPERRKLSRAPAHLAGMEAFRSVPDDSWRMTLAQLAVCVPLLGCLLIVPLVLHLRPDWSSSPAGLIVIILGLIGGTLLSLRFSWDVSHRFMQWQLRRDRLDLGSARVDEVYLGIAYAPEIIAYRLDTSWDRGYARIEDGCLAFRGYGPSFLLPLTRLDRVELVQGNLITMNLPRVHISYRDEAGEQMGLLFEVRDAPSRKEMVKRTEEIVEWLSRASSAQPLLREAPPQWPFDIRSSPLGLPTLFQRAKPSDKLKAGVYATGTYLGGLVFVVAIFRSSAGMFLTLPLFLALIAYVFFLQKVICKRESRPLPKP